MSRKILLTIDENGNLLDDNGIQILASFTSMTYVYTDATDEQAESADIVQLATLGMSADDLLKLKVAGVI
jgi:hypothetical protein